MIRHSSSADEYVRLTRKVGKSRNTRFGKSYEKRVKRAEKRSC